MIYFYKIGMDYKRDFFGQWECNVVFVTVFGFLMIKGNNSKKKSTKTQDELTSFDSFHRFFFYVKIVAMCDVSKKMWGGLALD